MSEVEVKIIVKVDGDKVAKESLHRSVGTLDDAVALVTGAQQVIQNIGARLTVQAGLE